MSEWDDSTPSPSFLTTSVSKAPSGSSSLQNDNTNHDDSSPFVWTPWTITQTIFLFLATGVLEIGGGWLVWQAVRGEPRPKPWWYALLGSVVMVAYAFLPTLQKADDSFGRIYAIYGGFFIFGSFLAGWVLDGDRPDKGDWIGGAVTLVGVLIILFWPRNHNEGDDGES